MSKPHISELTESDAMEAARISGIAFSEVFATDYGKMCVARDDSERPTHLFLFSVKETPFRLGLYDQLTDNIHLICRFLEDRYEFCEKQAKTP